MRTLETQEHCNRTSMAFCRQRDTGTLLLILVWVFRRARNELQGEIALAKHVPSIRVVGAGHTATENECKPLEIDEIKLDELASEVTGNQHRS